MPADVDPSDGAFLPTSLGDPSVAAECAKPWPSVGGTWTSTPDTDSAKDRDVQAKLEGAHLALTFATSTVSREGQHENQNIVAFDLPVGTGVEPGSYLQTRVSTAGGGWSCTSEGRVVGGGYGGYSEHGPTWDLTITSRTDTRIEGSYNQPLPDGSIRHVEFSAPIGERRMGRPAVACCLGTEGP